MNSGVIFQPSGGSGPNGIDELTLSQAIYQWTVAGAFELISDFTYDSDDVLTGATVTWPDGSSGTYTTLTVDSEHLVPSSFTVSHTNGGLTATQGLIVRNDAGNIVTNAGITVG